MRFGLGGGGRIARGGFSVGRGGVRGGVGVGPFSLSGGSRGGGSSGGGEVLAWLLAVCVVILAFLLAVFFTFVLLPVLATFALAALVTFRKDFDTLSHHEERLWLNRNAFLVLNLIPIVVGIFTFITWRQGITELAECKGVQDCALKELANNENRTAFIIYTILLAIIFISAIPLLISRALNPDIWSYPSNAISYSIKGMWTATRNSPRYVRDKILIAVDRIKKWADEE